MNNFDLDAVDYSYEILSELPKEELIELIQKQRIKIEELEGIRRNDQGEEIVSDDEIVHDGEEIVS